MLGLLACAERVEFFRDGTDLGFEGAGRVGEGEGVENAGFRISRIVADP
jgi:hypothetical protein